LWDKLTPPRGDKSSSAVVKLRQQRVARYYLRGLNADEITEQLRRQHLNVSRSTVYRDLEELRLLLAQEIQARMLWPLRETVMLKRELIRESWRIYHKPPEQRTVGRGKSERVVTIDPSFRELASIASIRAVASDLDRLAHPTLSQVTVTGSKETEASEKAVKSLTEDEQVTLARVLKRLDDAKG
jgi:hypothetical protein